MIKIFTITSSNQTTITARFKSICFIVGVFLFIIGSPIIVSAQCATPAACAGTSISGATNKTIPAGTTYYIASGNTYSGNITFTSSTSILCIQGTWTGLPAGSGPAGGTINVQSGGIINSGAWSFNSGSMILNNYVGGTVTISSVDISGGVFTFTNCSDLTVSGDFGNTGGTVTINNYASVNINGTLTSSNPSFTFQNYASSQVYIGVDLTFSDGTFINAANLCVTSTTTFTSGTFTNNSCFRTTSYDITGDGAFTNNNYLNVTGNFTNSGANNINNGTLAITGNYTNSGTFTNGTGSLITCVDYTNSWNIGGPAAGCAQIRATGVTSNSGTFAPNSVNLYFYDSGAPAGGFDSNTGTKNSLKVNNNTCTPTSYPACTMAGSACTTVLPIELIEFKAECKNGKMDLMWSTATETNNDYFTIERAKDAVNYEPVGVVDSKAPGGNSIQTLTYLFTDNTFPKEESANNNVFYYRLKQTDFDGNYTYSNIQFASCSSNCIGDITITSDNNDIFLSIPSICSTKVNISVYNALGQLILIKREYIEQENNILQLNVNNIATGLYIIQVNTINQSFQKKFGKQ